MNEIKPKGFDNSDLPTSESITNKAKLHNMKEVRIMGNLGAKETSEMVFAVAKLVSSIRLARADGKLTPSDATHFIDDVFPLVDGVTGMGEIPKEFADGFDEADQAKIQQAFKDGGVDVHENDKIGVELALKVVFALNDLAAHLGLIKPAAPEV